MTPRRREVLTRLADRGPLSIDEARDGHPNILPTLVGFGWVQCACAYGHAPARFAITEEGLKAIGVSRYAECSSRP